MPPGAGAGRLRASERRGVERAVFVAHGLTPDTRALLIDGTLDAVINQHPQTMVLKTGRILTNLRDDRTAPAGVEPMGISIVLRESLP